MAPDGTPSRRTKMPKRHVCAAPSMSIANYVHFSSCSAPLVRLRKRCGRVPAPRGRAVALHVLSAGKKLDAASWLNKLM